jgi:hypothetical protein
MPFKDDRDDADQISRPFRTCPWTWSRDIWITLFMMSKVDVNNVPHRFQRAIPDWLNSLTFFEAPGLAADGTPINYPPTKYDIFPADMEFLMKDSCIRVFFWAVVLFTRAKLRAYHEEAIEHQTGFINFPPIPPWLGLGLCPPIQHPCIALRSDESLEFAAAYIMSRYVGDAFNPNEWSYADTRLFYNQQDNADLNDMINQLKSLLNTFFNLCEDRWADLQNHAQNPYLLPPPPDADTMDLQPPDRFPPIDLGPGSALHLKLTALINIFGFEQGVTV